MKKNESDPPEKSFNGSLRIDRSSRKGLPPGNASSEPPPPADLVLVRFDAYELDEANARLLRQGEPLALAPTPFAVLCALARQPGALVSKGALLDAVWGHRYVSESVLKTAVSELRTALADDARHPRYIETVSRRGYRFIGAASTEAEAQPSGATAALGPWLPAPSITGRVKALARLGAAWSRTCAGKSGIIWVLGEPGIGKTTLIDHFVGSLGDVASARGQCIEQYGAGEPFFPVLEALAQLCRGDSAALPLLRTVAPAVLRQFPWLSTAQERDELREEPAVHPFRILRELGEFFDRYTERRPLLLVTEDLHWSDHATIQLIDHIARRRGNGRLLWLASFRIAEVIAGNHPLQALRNELRLHGLCEEIVLDSFSEQEVAEYIAARAPAFAASEAFVRGLHERTEGLPLFVAHVVTDLIGHQGSATAAPLQLLKMAIPDTLAEIIDRYVAQLGKEQRAALEAAAVVGAEFRVRTVAAALGQDPATVAAVCDEIARGPLWLTAPAREASDAPIVPYAFRHALFREVLYARIGELARRQLHRKVAVALDEERTSGVAVTPAELAMHFEYGDEPLTASRLYAEAAQSALSRLAATEALSLSERGLARLDIVDRAGDRDALELSLWTLRGVAAGHLFGLFSDEVHAAFRRAFALLASVPRHPMRGLLVYELGFVVCKRGEYAEAVALAERLEALSHEAQDAVLLLGACSTQSIVQMLLGRPSTSREWAERGLTLIETLDRSPADTPALGDPQISLLGHLAVQLVDLGLIEQARARLDELRARAQQLARPVGHCVAIWLHALCEVRLGNAKRVADLAKEMKKIVEEFPFPHGHVAYQLFGAWAEAHMVDALSGYRMIRAAHEENLRLGMRAGSSETLGYAADALLHAGELAQAAAQLDEALQVANALGERVYLPQLFLIEAAIADARGDPAATRESILRALTEARAREAPWLELMAMLALCKREDATAEERQALAALVDRLPEARYTTAVATARALLDARNKAR
jgi:DNA-binding winged helix-turn-helix (wHTH) protein/tetratricopeptide (TPR) repeat protein